MRKLLKKVWDNRIVILVFLPVVFAFFGLPILDEFVDFTRLIRG